MTNAELLFHQDVEFVNRYDYAAIESMTPSEREIHLLLVRKAIAEKAEKDQKNK